MSQYQKQTFWEKVLKCKKNIYFHLLTTFYNFALKYKPFELKGWKLEIPMLFCMLLKTCTVKNKNSKCEKFTKII